ncbi:MAG: Nif3-like dinuclear metal center hexameric protein [Phycisphaerales bacterium]|nr:MAG: Nif3-like dinuclear metal center hexameric protein [Phycisphaerales bacterium]
MKVKDIAPVVEEVAPLGLAQDWDNVGLLVGDPEQPIKNVLLTIDVTKAVVAEAKRLKAELIVSYHPVIWDGLKQVLAGGPTHIVYELIRAGIAVFSIHTALDVVAGGVNDGLAEMIGIEDGQPLGDYVEYEPQENYKLVAFVPVDALKKVTNAIFRAGAGAIGNYRNCGYHGEGTGTFLPLAGAKPAIGKQGKTETVHEMRFETIVPAEKLEAVVAALEEAHPYETPAFDIFRLFGYASRFGLGRMGRLSEPARVDQLIERIKKQTGAKAVGLVGDSERMVRTAAVCAGTCGRIVNTVMAAGADLYLTGEMKHHEALAAQEAGLTCVCLSHTVSERFILKKVAKLFKSRMKQVNIRTSKADTDPFTWKNV